jgi:NAD(P)-dependent dehydrogenase (short-subunit alcohol dehydrogenase family)
MRRYLVTGASRGIGLELVRELVERGDRVFAGYRDPSTAGRLLGLAADKHNRLTAVMMDVTDASSIDSAHEEVARNVDALDVLINNAGVGSDSRDFDDVPSTRDFGHLEAGPMLRLIHTNAVAPIIVAQRFMDLLRRGNDPKVVSISSIVGSITSKDYGGDHAYSASKAALNMFMRSLSADLRGEGVIVAVLHPGWVRTDMGGPNGQVSVEESAEGLIKVIDGLTMYHTGGFLDYRGHALPW